MFKNITFFRVPQSPGTPEGAELSALSPVGQLELTSVGLVPANAEGDLCPTVEGALHLRVGFEKKKLPASAIDRKLKEIERRDGVELRGRARKAARDEVIAQMLPNAPVTTSGVGVIVYPDGLIALDTASRGVAEQTISFLRGLYGSLPAVPLAPAADPAGVLTGWLRHGEPADTSLGDEAWLYDDIGTAKLKGVELDSEPVQMLLEHGSFAERVRLLCEGFAATICDDMVVRKLVVEAGVDAESAFEAVALITQAAVRDVFALLVEEFKVS